ncbi:DMT family transporter [Methylomonas sp. UP202]|uniref:DMT family transporter n=1 Tax=Methylomonas sp. UP202 TaxID=3040943 RepID=UPI00247AAA3A|nr:DMT family transporter [Methylomonas sp. UP202]WGS84049.1 DMT family transporter [Methylomonas sp. UP202]
MSIPSQSSELTRGYWFGCAGILGFSLTLPATRLAVAQLDPVFVGLGRAIVASLLAAVALWLGKARLPNRWEWCRLAATAGGVVIGFPLLSALALQRVSAVHGAVVIGLTPLLTALFGVVLSGERPARRFWLATVFGSLAILVFVYQSGAAGLQQADLYLLAAIVCVAYGYAEGARLAKQLGAWQTISWALLMSAPLLLPWVVEAAPTRFDAIGWHSLAGFAYVSVVSMYLAFFAWYRGLALGGTARIGQLQLLQPFLSMAAGSVLIGESVDGAQLATALAVLACVLASRKP